MRQYVPRPGPEAPPLTEEHYGQMDAGEVEALRVAGVAALEAVGRCPVCRRLTLFVHANMDNAEMTVIWCSVVIGGCGYKARVPAWYMAAAGDAARELGWA